jgi:predicted dinucleotide-binding enzyme
MRSGIMGAGALGTALARRLTAKGQDVTLTFSRDPAKLQNEGRSIGAVERWRSPHSNDAGEVKLIRALDVNEMPCRTIDCTVLFQVRRKCRTITW